MSYHPQRQQQPRRLSYASAVSGSASGTSQQQQQNQQPERSGFLSDIAPANRAIHSSSSAQHATSSSSHHQHQRSEPFGQSTNASAHTASGSTSTYHPGQAGDGFGGIFMDSRPPESYIPGYLKDTKYAERLEERHLARLAALKESRGSRLSTSGSISASSSSINLAKAISTHRGMSFDIVEKPLNTATEELAPLPSRWSERDKAAGIEVHSDGLDIRVAREPKTPDEAVSLRADHPMPREAGIYYYEITNLSQSRDCTIAIGFAGPRVVLNKLPGWEADSWAYHGDDGVSFYSNNQGRGYGPKWGFGDVIGCAINFRTGNAFFTRNGIHLGTAFHSIPKASAALYPCVGMKKGTDRLRANFGQNPFSFDIESYVQAERTVLLQEIASTDATPNQESPICGQNEDRQLEYLVAQYLVHESYIDTAKIFAQELRSGRPSITPRDASAIAQDTAFKDDEDMLHRQSIREAILSGDIDTALKETRARYPTVLETHESIYFKLRCRKFVEMIAQSTELPSATPRKKLATKHSISGTGLGGTNGHDHRSHVPEPMDVDDLYGDDDGEEGDEEDTMDVSDDNVTAPRDSLSGRHIDMMQQTIAYGQELQSEFNDDPKKEVRDALKETFALLAYQDVKKSKLAWMLDKAGRAPVAEELNCCILATTGKSPISALERLVQQTEVLITDAAHEATLVNLTTFFD